MTDKFMSGWGLAKGMINKLVIECDSYQEAEIVEDNARNRSEMIYVHITVGRKPYYNQKRFYTNYHSKKDYGSWFKKGYFKK